MVNKNKIFQIVEYIRNQEFPFDVMDCRESFPDIVSFYGLNEHLDGDEIALLQKALEPIAEMAQTFEIQLTIEQSLFPEKEIDSIINNPQKETSFKEAALV